jgi:hypothetical protein
MRRLLAVSALTGLLLLTLWTLAPAQVLNAITPYLLQGRTWTFAALQTFGAGLKITGGAFTRTAVKVKEVCPSGCEFTTICGATCSVINSNCVGGSAINAITDSSESNPYNVIVRPGTYNECVAINDKTDIKLTIEAGARIVPTVTSATSIDGGVIRIGNSSSTIVRRITIASEGLVRNDAFSSPEAALLVGGSGSTEVPNTSPKWDDITVTGGIWIGNHDTIQFLGNSTQSNTTTGIPRAVVSNLISIGGTDNVAKKGAVDLTIDHVYIRTMTNYCETTDTAVTNRNPTTAGNYLTVVTTGADGSHFTLDSSASTTDEAYVGRHGTIVEPTNAACTSSGTPFGCCTGSGAGTCDAGVCNGGVAVHFWVLDYAGSTKLLQTTALGFTPTADCQYQIDAVPNATEAPCHEVDWSAIRANAGFSGYWKTTGFHFGVVISQNTVPDLDYTKLTNSVIEVEVNDFGPQPNSSTKCNAQQTITGILGYTDTAEHQKALIDNVAVSVTNNIVVRGTQPSGTSDDNACIYPLTAIAMLGEFEDNATFNHVTARLYNTADPTVTDYGMVVADAGTFRLAHSSIEVNNSAAGYSGTTATLLQTVGALAVSDLTSPAAITTSGTMTWLSTSETFSTATLTNKTIDAEATGNVITLVSKIDLDAASCVAATAARAWDDPGDGATTPTAACNDTGAIQRPSADYSGSAVNTMERTLQLPTDWIGSIDVTLRYVTTAASPTGNVEWDLSTVCRAAGESWDGAFNAIQTITDAAGSQNNLNDATQTGITTTGCAAGEDLTLRVSRDGASDSNNDSAKLVKAVVTLRRQQ